MSQRFIREKKAFQGLEYYTFKLENIKDNLNPSFMSGIFKVKMSRRLPRDKYKPDQTYFRCKNT